jgi:thiol:disulfide interchange protein DsbA
MGFINKENKMKNKKIYLMALLLLAANTVNAEYRLGKDYGSLSRPLAVKQDGIVDVVEIFWYGCGHCFNLEPVIGNWASKQDNSVNFKKMPVTWSATHQLHAKLFYTIEALGIGDSAHQAVFTAIHKEGNYLGSEGAILDFLEKIGVDKSETLKYMNSFSVKQKVKRAIELSRQFKVTAVPMMFVDGQYKIEAKRSSSEMLKVVDHVIELQKPVS